MHSQIRPLAAVLLLGAALFLPGAALAQVARTAPALQLIRYQPAQDGAVYEYQVAGYGNSGDVLADVYLDVTMPRAPQAPRASALTGAFLFDAIADRYRETPFSHPDLQVSTPANWSAAIYLHGVLSWGATRDARSERSAGVARGKALRGFALKCGALPSLRRYVVEPYRPVPGEQRMDGEQSVDSALVLLQGFVVAPGWERPLVTGEFLEAQIKHACEALYLRACGRYMRLSDDVKEAEAKRNDRSYRLALGLMSKYLAEDKEAHQNARFVLSAAIGGLQERLPSRRPRS
jgi:hypothetical protein